ncbi:MAG: Cytochrome c-554 precursor [Ignavibacteriae bacterium]|nr:MAG: Cytochrome c-554 precursor [Ignavibacteriota bacterium]
MKKVISGILVLTFLLSGLIFAQNKYVGVKTCAPCHKGEKKGAIMEKWEKSKHAQAYQTLLTDAAKNIAKEKGLKKPAHESPECLECHVTAAKADAKLLDKNFKKEDGVGCETCHGAGSAYKSMAIMKDKKKAIENGLTAYADEKAIEAHCKTCHNEKSPTYKEFKFKEAWAQIVHKAVR